MKLKEISSEEFKKIADNHPQITFHQTKEWADLKKTNGWDCVYLSLDDNNISYGCSMILMKKVPIINRYMMYSPRGFLIDYNDYDILKTWTEEIKKWAKKKKAIFIKIDPYVEYQEHDNSGNIVPNGYNNKESHENLIKLKYKHFGFNLMQDTLQPRWMHVIDTDRDLNSILEDMESKTRQILRKNEKSGVILHDIEYDELKVFKEIMEKTSDRRAFIDRPMKYYENMWQYLHDSGILKIMIAEEDFNLYKENTQNELNDIKKELEDRIYKHDNKILQMNEKKYKSHNKQDEERIKQLENQLNKIDEYIKEYGNKTTLGGILFLIYGNEVLSLYGGSEEKLMQFQSAYAVHYAGIKYANENGYKKYNFYGITGDFREENPLYGLYLFKKSFGGKVVELIGEYDLIINKVLYILYKVAYKLYHFLKNIKKKFVK